MSDMSNTEARAFEEWASLSLDAKRLHAQGIGMTLSEFQERVLEVYGLQQGPWRIAAKLTTNIEDWMETGYDLQSAGYMTPAIMFSSYAPNEHYSHGGGI